jgi:gluconolactonase
MLAIRTVAEDLAFSEGPLELPDGDLAVVEIRTGSVTRIALAGQSMLVPGPQPDDYICGQIQRDARGRGDDDHRDCNGERLKGPNDLVFDAEGNFYFTDHGRVRARDRDQIVGPGQIGERHVLATVPGGPPYNLAMLDPLCVDAEGNVIVATLLHGGVTSISPEGADDPAHPAARTSSSPMPASPGPVCGRRMSRSAGWGGQARGHRRLAGRGVEAQLPAAARPAMIRC